MMTEQANGHWRTAAAFTLAELLIALLILGVIATFTIPKVLQVQQRQHWNANAKDVAAMLSAAHQQLRTDGKLRTGADSVTIWDYTPYFNYVRTPGSSRSIDWSLTGSDTCHPSQRPCYLLHAGGAVGADVAFTVRNFKFCSDNPKAAIKFVFDPDGVVSTPRNSIRFWLYYDGRITSEAHRLAGTIPANADGTCAAPIGSNPGDDPDWFSWE